MSRRKILFITPPYHCGVVEVAGTWPPPQFVSLAESVRRAGFEPHICDAMGLWKSHEDIVRAIEDVRPDYVATSAITATVPDALRVLENAKKVDPGIVTLIGGVHPTFMDQEILTQNPCVDYVVRGEGEVTLPELLSCLAAAGDAGKVLGLSFRDGGLIRRTMPRPKIADLDVLGQAWDLLDWKRYAYHVYPGSRLGIINTSRGCNSGCTFCSQQKFWNRTWRGRSVGSVLAEIELLHRRYGMDTILLGDEYPTCDRRRWEGLLDGLIARRLPIRFLMETRVVDIVRDRDILHKYRAAGFVHIYVGVEATNQATLDLIRKDLRVEESKQAIDLIAEHGMISETSFILGFPQETADTIRTTFELSRWYNPDFAHYLAITPWPYADLYRETKEHIAVRDYSKYNLIEPIIKPLAMTLEDIDRAMIACYRDFYMGKAGEIMAMRDEEKKRYLLTSMRLIMGSSFITRKMGGLSGIPRHCLEAMNRMAGHSAPVTAS